MMGDNEQFVNTREEIDTVIQALSDKFGAIVSPEVIFDVVQHCEGDYYASTVAMLSIVGDDKEAPITPPSNPFQPATLVANNQPPQSTMSYANISKTSGATPKPAPKPQRQKKSTQFTPQVESTIKYHSRGYRTLIMMRGVPGSGKSYLAKQIVDATVGASEENYRIHIASTDDYFYYGNTYNYDRSQIGDAHEWNQRRVRDMISRGVSPIIIDNTNIKIWEMEPYVKKGVSEGYLVELVEPTTPWASNAAKCAEKCSHDVPISKIKRMLDNYEYHSINGENLIKMFKLSYPTHKKPPVKRDIPPVDDKAVPELMQPLTEIRRISLDEPAAPSNDSQNIPRDFWEAVNTSTSSTDTVANNADTDEANLVANYKEKFMEIEKQLEHFDEIDQAWESGENWTERTPPVGETSASADPKPPRRRTISSNQPTTSQPTSSSLNPFLASNEVQDWRSYTQFLPPWNDEASSTNKQPTSPRIPIETRSISTCVEAGDYEIPTKKYKVVTGIPRDINFYYMPLHEKIPDKRMLDKSSMTNEQMLMDMHRCKNEDKHFKAFRKMFMNISKADLLEIFEKCCGDVNWAVEIVLDGVSSNSIETMRDYDIESDEDDSCQEQCKCTASYGIIPDFKEEAKVETSPVEEIPQFLLPKKVKKEKIVSENSIQLKRQIEKNIVLGDDHYSPHALKIRNFRHGEPSFITTQNTADSLQNEGFSDEPQPGTSNQLDREKSDDGLNGSDAGEEETVNVNLGFDFIKKLDTLFDREGVTYSENIVPTICMPLSTLTEINALWMESLTNQLEGQAEFANVLMKQDEEFARELTAKEEELESRGVAPEVPDLKEIMDMEYALSTYRKDMELKSQVSPTLADKLSRNKLHAMFPDIPQEMLNEMLMAHDNNFKDTVEVVLMSLGKTEILAAEKGLEKYIAQKEMDQHLERLEIEKQKQIESEKVYPSIASKLDESELNMETVERLRGEAYQLLESRGANYQKAQEYIRRGMTTAAGYYSSLATMQSKQYEMVNLMAANTLIQVHSANNDSTTLDLHHLHVGEAIQALDLFLDKHLVALREDQKKGIYKRTTLFFITGRGLHSQNGPKIRPAVRKRLRTRGLKSNMLNPGLVSIELSCGDKMTHQL